MTGRTGSDHFLTHSGYHRINKGESKKTESSFLTFCYRNNQELSRVFSIQAYLIETLKVLIEFVLFQSIIDKIFLSVRLSTTPLLLSQDSCLAGIPRFMSFPIVVVCCIPRLRRHADSSSHQRKPPLKTFFLLSVCKSSLSHTFPHIKYDKNKGDTEEDVPYSRNSRHHTCGNR